MFALVLLQLEHSRVSPSASVCFENLVLRRSVIINTCVNSYLLAQRWLGAGLTPHYFEEKAKKALLQKTSTDRKEHHQISPL